MPQWLSVWLTPEAWQGFAIKAAKVIVVAALFEVWVLINNRLIDRALLPAAARGKDRAVALRVRRRSTLRGVARSLNKYVLYFIALIVILNILGVKIEQLAPVLGAAGIIGLAVGFGAQQLVRDVITGFYILFEDQFDVGDYVTIGAISGTVEEMALRVTRIRDDTGKIYILANSGITQVCNHSKGKVESTVDFNLAADQDLDRASEVINQVGKEMAEANPDLLEPPQVKGISAFDANKVGVQIGLVVLPPQKEEIAMELRRRLHRRLKEEEIKVV